MVGERGQRREKGGCMGEIRRKAGMVRGVLLIRHTS